MTMTREDRALKVLALKTAGHRGFVSTVLPARALWLCLATVTENVECEPEGRDLAARIMTDLSAHIAGELDKVRPASRRAAWQAMEANLDLWVAPYRKTPANPYAPKMSPLLLSMCFFTVKLVEEGLFAAPDEGTPFARAYDELTTVIAMHPDFNVMERSARRRAEEMLERAQALGLYRPTQAQGEAA